MRNKTIILLSLLIFFTALTAPGQKQVNSPYSRFNIGTLEPAGPFRSQAMGGISVSLRDNTSIFYSNPASYSSLDTSSFVFDFGIDYTYDKISAGDESYFSDDMNFDHLVIGFPLARGFGMTAGIVPLSNGYYRISDEVTSTDPRYDPVIGAYSSIHSGDGGFNNFFIGTGIKLNKYFSAGLNMSILFGQLNRSNQFSFDDVFNVYHNNSSEKLQMGGINFDYGLQFTLPLKNGNFFNAGLSYTTGKNYNSEYEKFVYRYTSQGTTDTISFVSETSGSIKIPGTIRAGISFGKINKLTAGFDFITTKWSASNIPGSSAYLADTKSFLFGLEYTPDKFSNFNFLKRIDYLVIDGEQLREIGASAGIGVPMRRITQSKANLFFDYTRKSGSAANSLHTENLYTIGFSINLYDFWFIKRKYD